VQATAQQEKEHQGEAVAQSEEEAEVQAEAEGSEEYNPDEEYDFASGISGIADSKPSSLARQLSIAPSASSRRGEKVPSTLHPPPPLPTSLGENLGVKKSMGRRI
jgi:hypothetical protein